MCVTIRDKFKALDRKHKRQQQQHRQKAFNGANISTIDRVDRTFSGGCRTIIARSPTRVADSLALRCGAASEHANTADRTHTNRPRPTRGRSTMRATATMAIMQAVNHARGFSFTHCWDAFEQRRASASKAPPPPRGRPRVVESVDNTDLYNKTSS